ncbi:DUF882 domain-containing protein [Thioclava sp. BHET1]|nr:DUF882 domain-containing protein [Thioclava sp. BHET1]
MTTTSSTGLSRRALLRAFAVTSLVAAPTYANAFGFLRGAGDIRRVKMYSGRTGETVDMVYWVDGHYVPEALAELNVFMRDWRTDSVTTMSPATVDIIAATHRLLDVSEPYMLLSGYRTAQTNAMLRRRSHGVAKHSLHMKGEAADLRLQSRSVPQIYSAAMSCRAGGVGKYMHSDFVHMDCGPVRTWAGT